MNYPPLTFVVFKANQPLLRRVFFWKQFLRFTQKWNSEQKAKFEERERDEWKLILPAGCTDKEFLLLLGELERLNKVIYLVWEYGIEDNRTAEEFSLCPFVHFESDRYADPFYVNGQTALVSETRCEHCKDFARFSAKIVEVPVIDESPLEGENTAGLDFISMPNGGLLITPAVKLILESLDVKGYALQHVISKQSGKPSEKLFLMIATRTVLDPCHEHTPRAEGTVCAHCGSHSGPVCGHFHVQDAQLKGCEIFTVSRFGVSGFFFSQRVFQEFKKKGLKELHVLDGIEYCRHEENNT